MLVCVRWYVCECVHEHMHGCMIVYFFMWGVHVFACVFAFPTCSCVLCAPQGDPADLSCGRAMRWHCGRETAHGGGVGAQNGPGSWPLFRRAVCAACAWILPPRASSLWHRCTGVPAPSVASILVACRCCVWCSTVVLGTRICVLVYVRVGSPCTVVVHANTCIGMNVYLCKCMFAYKCMECECVLGEGIRIHAFLSCAYVFQYLDVCMCV